MLCLQPPRKRSRSWRKRLVPIAGIVAGASDGELTGKELAHMATNNTSFRPGQSGNPTGRPKTDPTVRDLARQYTAEAIEVLVSILRDPNASKQVKCSIPSDTVR